MVNNEDATRLHKLGKYRIDGILGQGAMGVVYQAFDTAIERYVAIKTVRTELLTGDNVSDWLARFRREVQAAGRCLHPNIVTIFEYGEDCGVPYIVMEYVQGRELRSHLKEHGCFDVAVALQIITQVLQALNFAHAHGVVHRDIKPANIILLADGQVKVTDFGIARLDENHLTQHGLVIGTPDYMAPEQFMGTEITPATDFYATGLVLYELLCGQKPFAGKSSNQLMYQVLSESPRPILALNPQVPATLQPVLDRALAKKPGERFQTANEFVRALTAAVPDAFRDASGGTLLTRMPAPACPPATTEPSDPPANTPPGSGSGPSWAPAVLQKIEQQLMAVLGPVAKVVLNQAARKAGSIEELYQMLADHLGNESEKTEFLETGKRHRQYFADQSATGIPVSQPVPAFNTQHLEKAVHELTLYLGPIAKVLVHRTASEANSLADLYQRLAQHIRDERERATFLRGISHS